MNSCVDTELKNLYEQENLPVEQIAECSGFEVIAVKAKLMQISSKYRKDCGQEEDDEDELNFSKDEDRQFKQIITEVALGATNPDGSVDYRTRLKAAVYARDDKRGRHDTVKTATGVQFNIMNFNEMLSSARSKASEQIKKMSSSSQQKTIEA